MSRFVFAVLDGVGVGAQPDAGAYGDAGSNTLANLAHVIPLDLPNLQRLGLGNVTALDGVLPAARPPSLAGRLRERSAGKDTTTGHWEHMGLVTERPFPTYPDGFPEAVLRPFREAIGKDILGNRPASGTQIIHELGQEHLRTGYPIVYTSADSVFQIACHVDVCPLEELYRHCRTAREILQGEHAVGRVIARPFRGAPGEFVRTPDRKDFSLPPHGPTYLDLLTERGVRVVGLGKISQIFAGRGISEEHKVASNEENLRTLIDLLDRGGEGLYMTNLVDFDTTWGHRNDVEGFARGLAEVDGLLPPLLDRLGPDDRLLLTADHGVDPTTSSTDHSREYVPLLYLPAPENAPACCYLGSFADTGATAFRFLTGETPPLEGRPVQELDPADGWRRYPSIAWRGRDVPRPFLAGDLDRARAAATLRRRFGDPPAVAVVLGSGLGGQAEGLTDPEVLEYAEIPGWHQGSIAGHAGRMIVGRRHGHRVAALMGRPHLYEGLSPLHAEFPVRVLAEWGIGRLVITNASGGLGPDLRPGDVAPVSRILDFQSVAPGGAPRRLAGTDMTVLECLRSRGSGRQPICYAALPGPQYETEAEVRMLRVIGAHAVGMSTAIEVAAAREEGLEVATLTTVTNAAGAPPPPLREEDATRENVRDDPSSAGARAHEDVIRRAEEAADRVARLLDEILHCMLGRRSS